MSKTMNRRAFLGTALTFGALAAVNPTDAFGVTAAQKKAEVQAVASELSAMQDELAAAVDQYNRAQDNYNSATAKVEEAQAKIDEAQAKIDKLQGNLSERATSMYRNGSMSYLDVLLGVGSFDDFATVWDTLNTLNEEDADLVAQTKTAKAELEAAKEELDAQQQAAADALAEAESYQASIEAKEAEYQATYNSLSSEYQSLLAEEEAAQEQAAERAAAAYQPTTSGGGGGGGNSGGGGGGARGSIPTHGSVVDYASSRIGCPYRWGAAGPDAFDCSGLTMWCYAQAGVASLPHYTESQLACASRRFSPSAAAPGDVLYRSGHVGISTGGTSCIHAPGTGRTVCYGGGSWTYGLAF